MIHPRLFWTGSHRPIMTEALRALMYRILFVVAILSLLFALPSLTQARSRSSWRHDDILAREEWELSMVRDALCWPEVTDECETYLEMERDYLERLDDIRNDRKLSRNEARWEMQWFQDALNDEGILFHIETDEDDAFSIALKSERKKNRLWNVDYDRNYLRLRNASDTRWSWYDDVPRTQTFRFDAVQEGTTYLTFRLVRPHDYDDPFETRVYVVRIEE